MKKCFVSMLVAVATTTMVLLFSACGGASKGNEKGTDDPMLYAVEVDGKWGYVDGKGNMVIEPQFDYASAVFSEGLAAVAIEKDYFKEWGYIDMNGKFVIEPQFAAAEPFTEGLAHVIIMNDVDEESTTQPRVDNMFINKKGEVVIRWNRNDSIKCCANPSEGLIVFGKWDSYRGRKGFVDMNGRVVISPKYDEAQSFSEGLAAVRVGENWGYIDKTGRMVIEPQFSEASPFSDGMAAVRYVLEETEYDQTISRIAFIDREGKPVTAPLFGDEGYVGMAVSEAGVDTMPLPDGPSDGDDYLLFYEPFFSGPYFSESYSCWNNYRFSQGLAAVEMNGKYGYVNKEGKMAVEPRFDAAWEFLQDGVALAAVVGKNAHDCQIGFIDKTGKFLIEWDMQKLEQTVGFEIEALTIGNNDVFDFDNHEYDCMYHIGCHIGDFNETGGRLAWVCVVGKKEVRTRNGRIVVPVRRGWMNRNGEFVWMNEMEMEYCEIMRLYRD